MITNIRPLSLAEVKELTKNVEEKKNLEDYLKKFCKIDKAKSEELKEKLKAVDNLKIKDEHIIKMIDFLPKDAEEVNKIFNDISLSEEEVNELLEIIQKY